MARIIWLFSNPGLPGLTPRGWRGAVEGGGAFPHRLMHRCWLCCSLAQPGSNLLRSSVIAKMAMIWLFPSSVSRRSRGRRGRAAQPTIRCIGAGSAARWLLNPAIASCDLALPLLEPHPPPHRGWQSRGAGGGGGQLTS